MHAYLAIIRHPLDSRRASTREQSWRDAVRISRRARVAPDAQKWTTSRNARYRARRASADSLAQTTLPAPFDAPAVILTREIHPLVETIARDAERFESVHDASRHCASRSGIYERNGAAISIDPSRTSRRSFNVSKYKIISANVGNLINRLESNEIDSNCSYLFDTRNFRCAV